ncbi:Nucleoside-diphosphate-sugar epimerases [hydrothermal vent metagenome]|uniref:Nucleoside-diphosphate-sugar epimerases n=1 Tax=hydrothermal vent metagenome TaxID=652676 RepID=A0A3B0SSU9_9ZZZZ
MGTHLIVGAGPTGSGTARKLADLGHRVIIATRSGTDIDHPGVEARAVDASDATALGNAVDNIDAVYNCANPPYFAWPTDWPPLAKALLATTERHDAVLVTMSNLYGYGPVAEPMTEAHPLAATFPKGRIRAQMWEEALEAHQAGRVRVTEARASDFYGPGVGQSAHMGSRMVDRALAGKTVTVVGDPDVVHSWTAMDDVTTMLSLLGTDERAWGRAWHVPTAPAVSQRDLIHQLCSIAGVDPVKVRGYSSFELWLAGIFSKSIREVGDVLYQLEKPFIIDSSDTTATFGIEPTPTRDVLTAIVEQTLVSSV